jgi:hypothetical protein
MTTMACNNNSDDQQSSLPTTITTLDLNDVFITLPKISKKSGNTMAYWCLGNSMSNTDVIFQLCPDGTRMSVAFPPSQFNNAVGTDKYGMSLHVTDPLIMDALAALDAQALQFFLDHRESFFKKSYTDDMIRFGSFCPIVKPVDLEKGYGARVGVKIMQNASARHPVEVFTYNAKENTMSPTHFKDIRKGDDVVPIVSMGGIWCVSGGKCGYTLEACRILVIPNQKANGTGFAMGSGRPTPTVVYPTIDSVHDQTSTVSAGMDEGSFMDQVYGIDQEVSEPDSGTVTIDPITLQVYPATPAAAAATTTTTTTTTSGPPKKKARLQGNE